MRAGWAKPLSGWCGDDGLCSLEVADPARQQSQQVWPHAKPTVCCGDTMNAAILRQRAWQFRRELGAISAVSLLSSLSFLALPWLAGQFLGGVIGDARVDLRFTLGLLAAALIANTALTIAVSIVSEVASGRILAALRREMYRHLQLLPMAFHDRSRLGDLMALITYEVGYFSSFLTATLANVPSMLLVAGGSVVLLFLLDPAMALIVPVLVIIFFIVMKLIGRNLRVLGKRQRKAESRLLTLADSDFAMLPAVKAFAAEEVHRSRYFAAIETARRLRLAQIRITAFVTPLVALIAASATIILLLTASDELTDGARAPGDLFAFLLYAALLTRPAAGLVDIYGRWQIAKGTLTRMGAVLGEPIEPGFTASGRMMRAKGRISFEGIGFAYPGRPAVCSDLDLIIEPGEIIALTGDNGVGKSTLIRLLLRFYDPQAGRITLDGVDIASLHVQDLRRQFGYVPQRPLLFNGSIAENIAFGAPKADPDQIERAARFAQAWQFVQALPNGLATQIGDNGIRLSGGQQQRIALARALYHDPPIYILDEATSMYDLDGEAAFVEECLDQLAGRTVIIITHRPASLALAHRIIRASPEGLVSEPSAQGRA
jgi:ATP-binding cassette, subfamily B, bacterial